MVAVTANVHDRSYYESKFYDWLSEHKIVAASGSHFVKMLQNFANNDDIIETHNAKKEKYTLGHNQFSHLSLEEFKEYAKLGLQRPDGTKADAIHEAPAAGVKLASSVDWVSSGAVTGVKDQGQW